MAGAARRDRPLSRRAAAIAAVLCLALAALSPLPALARPDRFGIVRHLPITAPALLLQGEITAGTDGQLKAALAAYPETTYLVLDSSGGQIEEALRLSRTIRDHGLATFIPPGAICASACALLWISGERRHAAGRLGVHRFVTRGGFGLFTDEAGIQDTVGQIVALVNDMGVPPFVLVPMLRTPNADVYWFTVAEMARLRAGEPVMWKTARDIAGMVVVGTGVSAAVQRNAASGGRPDRKPAAAPANTSAQRPFQDSDCAAIPEVTAQALCRDPHLALLDADLTAATRAATLSVATADMAAFLDRKTEWERQRAACRGNIACLNRAYRERLAELGPVSAP